MAEMPTCRKCGEPHWRFAACEDAPALAAKQQAEARERERLKVRPELATPAGYVRVAPNKFARVTATKPSYVQIAPGKFRKAN